jgi:Ca2+-binding RTX toxin-like protein
LIGILAAVVATFALPLPASAGDPTVLVPYEASGWRYHVVAHGGGTGFQKKSFDDSSWPIGQAAFGTIGGGCDLGDTIHTEWPVETDILLRRTIDIDLASSVEIGVAIDNDVFVYWDGAIVGSQEHENCAERGSLVVTLSNVSAGSHLLALRGVDRGAISYIDARVTATTLRDGCTIVGTNGDDVLVGTSGADVICGLRGDDTLLGLKGNDVLRGGRGFDTVSFASGKRGVNADLEAGIASGQGQDELRGIEGLVGTPYGDRLAGNDKANTIRSLDGADLLLGGGGPDELLSDGGNDYVRGGPGSDTINGGSGVDFCDGGPGIDAISGCE